MSNKRQVRPWDLFNKNMNRVPSEIRNQRLSICRECPFYVNATEQCKKCLCIMPQKTKLADAFCPIHKWESYQLDPNEVNYKELIGEDDE